MAAKRAYPNRCIQGERRSKGRGERKQAKNITHATCAEESRAVCTCYSSSEEILFLCWDLSSAPLSSNSHRVGHTHPQLQDEMDKPFSQEARRIPSSLSGKSPKQKHRQTNTLGQRNWRRTGNFVLKTLYPHIIALRCSRSRTLKASKNLVKAWV